MRKYESRRNHPWVIYLRGSIRQFEIRFIISKILKVKASQKSLANSILSDR